VPPYARLLIDTDVGAGRPVDAAAGLGAGEARARAAKASRLKTAVSIFD